MFDIGKTYNIYTKSSVTLQPVYKDMKAVANFNFDTAIKFTDVVTIWNKLTQEGLTLLPYRNVLYTMFQNPYGETVILGNDWIESYNEVTSINAVIKVNNITTEDLTVIQNALVALGYNNIEVDTEEITA